MIYYTLLIIIYYKGFSRALDSISKKPHSIKHSNQPNGRDKPKGPDKMRYESLELTQTEARTIAHYELRRAKNIIDRTEKQKDFMRKNHNEFRNTFYGQETTDEAKTREVISYAGFQADLHSAAFQVYKDMSQLLTDFWFVDAGYQEEDIEIQNTIKLYMAVALDLCSNLSRRPESVAHLLGIDLADKPQTMITSYNG